MYGTGHPGAAGEPGMLFGAGGSVPVDAVVGAVRLLRTTGYPGTVFGAAKLFPVGMVHGTTGHTSSFFGIARLLGATGHTGA